MTTKPRGILFDYGGTLVEEVEFNTRAGRAWLLSRAVTPPDEAQLAHLSAGHRSSATTASANPAVNQRAATGNNGYLDDQPEPALGGHGEEPRKPPEHGHARS